MKFVSMLNRILNITGLAGLDITPIKPQKLPTTLAPPKSKTKELKDAPKKESFVSWYAKNKKSLQEEFPELSPVDLTKTALARYKEKDIVSQKKNTPDTLESKKRKLSPDSEQNNQPKRASSTILSSFAFEK